MKKVQDYQARAEQCRQLASRARTAEDRNAMLKMADAWEELARSREAMLEKKVRISRLFG
jgi:hypothetical protein